MELGDTSLPIFADLGVAIRDSDTSQPGSPTPHQEGRDQVAAPASEEEQDIEEISNQKRPPPASSDKTTVIDNDETEFFASLRTVPKPRVLMPLSTTKPLVPQLKIIWDRIENNKVDGDLSDPFPSLIGEDDYLPLFETLVKYTGAQLHDLSSDIVDFGENVYSEVRNFDLDDLEHVDRTIRNLYEKKKTATLEEWVKLVQERFHYG